MKNFLFFCKKNFYFLFCASFIFISSFFTLTAGASKFHICFFELDNTITSENFLAKNPDGAEVYIYQTNKGERSRTAFEKMVSSMVSSGQKCDGLVFSGHYTGDWFGEKGILLLKDMEALSCKPEYREWFKNIKALWLDGCNTVTDNSIQTNKNPDSETMRVLAGSTDKTKISKSNMEFYQQSYLASLDENTALSSRYLRMFPNVQIYGVNGSAPTGEQKYGESFIFNHIINLGEALKDEEQWANIKTDFERGLTVISNNDPCDPKTIETWENVSDTADFEAVENQDYKEAYRLGCDLILAKQVLDDPESTEAQKALAEKIIKDSEEAERILSDSTSTEAQRNWAENVKNNLDLANAILDNPNSEDAITLAKASILNTLKAINTADQRMGEDKDFPGIEKETYKYSHLLFNNIYDTWNTAKKHKEDGFFDDVKSILKEDSFTNSLKERIESDFTASLRKGDYIKFYTEIHDIDISKNDKEAKFVKDQIQNLFDVAGQVFPELESYKETRSPIDPDEKEITKRILAVSVVDQLFQYDLLSEEQIEELIKNKNLFPAETKNPFIKDTHVKLSFHDRSRIIPTITNYEPNSEERRRAIRAGMDIYLDQFDYNQSNESMTEQAKNELEKLVQKIDIQKAELNSDFHAFFQALDFQLTGKTDQEQIDFLLDLSRNNTTKNFEIAVLTYTSARLHGKEKERERICKTLEDEARRGERKYKLGNCP